MMRRDRSWCAHVVRLEVELSRKSILPATCSLRGEMVGEGGSALESRGGFCWEAGGGGKRSPLQLPSAFFPVGVPNIHLSDHMTTLSGGESAGQW